VCCPYADITCCPLRVVHQATRTWHAHEGRVRTRRRWRATLCPASIRQEKFARLFSIRPPLPLSNPLYPLICTRRKASIRRKPGVSLSLSLSLSSVLKRTRSQKPAVSLRRARRRAQRCMRKARSRDTGKARCSGAARSRDTCSAAALHSRRCQPTEGDTRARAREDEGMRVCAR
jgi:hypothetical protein